MIYDRLLRDGGGVENNKRWQRHPDNPILRPTPGTWAGEWIANETVIQVEDEYLMYLDGKLGPVERIGVARAKVEGFDGVHWEEYSISTHKSEPKVNITHVLIHSSTVHFREPVVHSSKQSI